MSDTYFIYPASNKRLNRSPGDTSKKINIYYYVDTFTNNAN